MTATTSPANRLLSALKRKTFQDLAPKLERVELTYKEVIYEPRDQITHVYFPESGIISLLSAVDLHSTLEVGIVGSEGMVGVSLYLGDTISQTRCLVQGSGFALRLTARHFLSECRRDDELPKIVRRYTHSLIGQISQSAACNRFHEIEPRLARWLLMTQDRMRASSFAITQDFLSNMLGVRREAVNKAASHIQKQGIISYQRGLITIQDRKRLESQTCPCYEIISGQ